MSGREDFRGKILRPMVA